MSKSNQKNQKDEVEKFIQEVNKYIDELSERIAKGEITIRIVEERIITPDQKIGHQFGYSSSLYPNGERAKRYN